MPWMCSPDSQWGRSPQRSAIARQEASDDGAIARLGKGRAITFDRVVLQEPIALGQRIAAFEVEAEQGGAWHRIATGTTIGHKRILPVPPTRTARVRVTIHSARATPLVSEFAVY